MISADHSADISSIRAQLAEGFFADNLRKVAWKCRLASRIHPATTILWSLAQLLYDVAWEWEIRPIDVSEAHLVEEELRGTMESLLQALEENRIQTASPILDSLVEKFAKKIGYSPRTY